MKILTYALGQMQANCYFLIKEDQCLIIDPADEASFILEQLQRNRLKLVGMLATHGHFDHIMAVGEIQKSLNVPFYIDERDQFLISRLEETARHFLGYDPIVIKPTSIKNLPAGKAGLIEVKNKIEEFEFERNSVPGHTPGSVYYYFRKDKVVFSGDTLFKRGIGRYDFSYSDKKELKQSLEKLLKLPKETIVYPGHGEQTTIKAEKDILRLFPL